MRFSRIQGYFGFLSFLVIVILFAVTYLHHGGFARSLSFDGGVRISLRLAPYMKKRQLEEMASKAGFPSRVLRLSDPRTNTWDLELGPEVRDIYEKEVRKKEEKRRKKKRALQSQGLPIPQELKESVSVSGEIQKKLLKALNLPKESVVSSETIAASYGANLISVALRILIYTIVTIGLYLSFRFDFPFAVGSSIALLHDLLFAVGFIGVAQIEPSTPVIAAVLTIMGYSINDTIVIFDRIRDNTEDRTQATSAANIDLSITQTLSRTVITSVLTLVAVLALLLGGERSLRDFAIILLVGVLVGTYSSIFIASPFVRYYKDFRIWLRR